MPKFSDFWLAYLAQFSAAFALLWSVFNAVRLRSHDRQLAESRRSHEKEIDGVRREHDKEIERLRTDLRREVEQGLLAEESRLRVATELRLRLHQESWKLLREIQDANFKSYEALRDYSIDVAYCSTKGNPPELKKKAAESYNSALAAVMRSSGLCHCAPPDRRDLRKASSVFTKVFNEASGKALLNGDEKPDWLSPAMKELNDAMLHAARAIDEWNTALWQAHDDAARALAPTTPTAPGPQA